MADKIEPLEPITPEQFVSAVDDLWRSYQHDPEAWQCETDTLMENVLVSLGYGEGVSLIRESTRWCA